MTTTKTPLTRGTKKIIEQAIVSVPADKRNNRLVLCAKISEMLEDKFEGDNLDYQLGRMGLVTTGNILEKIDLYWHKYGSRVETLTQEVALPQAQ